MKRFMSWLFFTVFALSAPGSDLTVLSVESDTGKVVGSDTVDFTQDVSFGSVTSYVGGSCYGAKTSWFDLSISERKYNISVENIISFG